MRRVIASALVIILSLQVLGSSRPAAAADSPLLVVYVPGIFTDWRGASADVVSLVRAMRNSPRLVGVTLQSSVFSYRYPRRTWEWRDTIGCDDAPRLIAAASLFTCADLLARQLRDLLAATPGSRMYVIGHSQGGVIALLGVNLLTLAERQRIQRVITLDSPIQGVSPESFCQIAGPGQMRQWFCQGVGEIFARANLAPGAGPVVNAQIAARSLVSPAFLVSNSADPVIPSASALVPDLPGFLYQHSDGRGALDDHGLVLRDRAPGLAVADAITYPPEWRFRMSGFVRDAVSGAPIEWIAAGAHTAVPPTSTNIGGFTDTTGFWSTMAPAGTYRVGFFPQAPNLRPYIGEFWNNHRSWEQADIVQLPGAFALDERRLGADLDRLP